MKRSTAITVAIVLLVAGVGAASVFGARQVSKPADHTPQWHWLHGGEAVRDYDRCLDCHDDFFCTACHIAEWPHEEGWQAEHGPEATRLDGRGCYLCHRPGYCDPCHLGVRMPHPPGFLAEHPRSGYTEESCWVCHVTSDCAPCHQRHDTHQTGGLVIP